MHKQNQFELNKCERNLSFVAASHASLGGQFESFKMIHRICTVNRMHKYDVFTNDGGRTPEKVNWKRKMAKKESTENRQDKV